MDSAVDANSMDDAATRTESPWIFPRSLIIWFLGISMTLLMGPIATLLAILRVENILHRYCCLWGRIGMRILGAKLHVHGKENLYNGESALILPNHQSISDILLFYAVFRCQFRWMAKASLFKIPIFGWAMSGAGYVPVNRESKKAAQESLFAAANQIKAGKSVLVFPEGTVGRPDGRMIAFKKGAFIIAKKSGAVLQPVTLWGAHKIIPDQKDRWMQRVYPGHVHVYIHPPIMPKDYTHLTADQLSDHVRSTIEKPLNENHLNAGE